MFSRTAAPLALIVAIALAGLGFLINHPEGLFNRYSDLLAFHLATQTVLYDAWQLGHRLPLWRSDTFSGAPAFANPQAMYTHPFHLLFMLGRPERIVGLVVWLQLLLGAIGAYCAARVIRLSAAGRLFVAVATLFSFKTILAVYAGWLTLISGLAAMPLFFAAAAVALELPSIRSSLLLGGAGALLLHSGHPQFPYYACLFVVIWSLVAIGRQLQAGKRAPALRQAEALAGGAIVALGLSAYVIAPIAADVPMVARWGATYDIFLGDHPIGLTDLLTLFNPEAFGTPLDGSYVQAWESVQYFGVMPSLLAIAAVSQGRRRPYVTPLLAGLIVCLALAMQTPLTRIAYELVPGFHLFRLPARVFFVGAFFVTCLAGVGFDIVLSSAGSVQTRRIVGVIIIATVALEGSFWARRYLRVPEAAPYLQESEYVHALVADDPTARIASLSRSLPSYGAAAPLGLQLVNGYDPFNLRDYQMFIDILQYGRRLGDAPVQPNWTDLRQVVRFDMLAALNVRYVVAPDRVDLPTDEYTLIGAFENQPQFRFYEGTAHGPVYVYQNRRPPGRAFFAADVVTVPDRQAAFAAVLKTDLRTTAILTSDASLSPSPAAAQANDRVNVLRSSPGQLALETRSTGSRFLVVSEVWLPGWRAFVDGNPVALLQADIALQGLWVPPGNHRVELTYWPRGLTAGLVATALTAAGIIALAAVRRRPSLRRNWTCN
jgi:hypothetical protein